MKGSLKGASVFCCRETKIFERALVDALSIAEFSPLMLIVPYVQDVYTLQTDVVQLSEEEQGMYPSSLENERFIVAVVNCKRQGYAIDDGCRILENDAMSREITCAFKFEQ